MPKAVTTDETVADENVTTVSNSPSITVDIAALQEILLYVTSVTGYYGGTTYDHDKDYGIQGLAKYGINFTE